MSEEKIELMEVPKMMQTTTEPTPALVNEFFENLRGHMISRGLPRRYLEVFCEVKRGDTFYDRRQLEEGYFGGGEEGLYFFHRGMMVAGVVTSRDDKNFVIYHFFRDDSFIEEAVESFQRIELTRVLV